MLLPRLCDMFICLCPQGSGDRQVAMFMVSLAAPPKARLGAPTCNSGGPRLGTHWAAPRRFDASTLPRPALLRRRSVPIYQPSGQLKMVVQTSPTLPEFYALLGITRLWVGPRLWWLLFLQARTSIPNLGFP